MKGVKKKFKLILPIAALIATVISSVAFAATYSVSYKPGEGIVVPQGGATYLAVWDANTYIVSYNGNGSTSGSMESDAFVYDAAAKAISANQFQRTGYDFAGWNTNANGSGTSYANQASVRNLTSENGKTVVFYAQWTPHHYGIHFDGNKGTGSTDVTLNAADMSNVAYNTELTITQTASRNGYLFKGWNTKADGSGTAYAVGAKATGLTELDNVTVTLYAQWTPITYTVKYDKNNATSGTVADSTHTFDVSKNLNANAYTRTGYTFKGWNTKADGSGDSFTDSQSVKNLTITDKDTITLYAQWTANTYTVSFNKNSGSGSTVPALTNSTELTLKYDESKTLTASASRTGYQFVGWNTKADGTGTTYTTGSTIKNLTSVAGGKVTLYAKWSANTYTIKYDGNNATGGTVADTKLSFDSEGTLNVNTYTRTGYIYNGWNTKADGSGESFVDKATVKNLSSKNNDAVTLYAQWIAIGYKVDYNGNGATSGKMTQSNHSYDVETALNLNVYIKRGYKFSGWNTKADGSGNAYTDKAKVKNLTTSNEAVVTLYAQWTPITYTISFDGNKGTGSTNVTLKSSDKLAATYDKEVTISAYAERTGYTFSSWNTYSDGTGTKILKGGKTKNLAQTQDLNVVLYAQWTPITYTVAYNANNGTGTTASSTHTYDVAKTLTDNAFTRTGYTFNGWNLKADGTGTSYTNKASVKNLSYTKGATVTLYAKWSANTYAITFDKQQGTGGTDKVNGTFDAAMPSATMPTRTGYIFQGYFSKTNGQGTKYYNADGSSASKYNVDGDLALYAYWKPITYKVVFDANKGNGTMTSVTMTYDVNTVLTASTITRTGYDFMGWNTLANGNGSSYADKATVRNLTTKNGDTVTLYAQWGAVAYSVKYNAGTLGKGTMANSKHEFDVYQKLTKNAFTRTGYHFNKWSTGADGTGTTYTDEQSVANLTTVKDSVVNLYANWTPNTYNVKYDGNTSTSGSMSNSKHTYDTAAALTANSYAKTGYTFSKWNLKTDGSSTSYADKVSVKNLTASNGGTVTLYAQWTANTYTITFDGNKGTGSSDVTLTNAANVTATYDAEAAINASASRSGYTFKGWSINADGSGEIIPTGGSVKNLTAEVGGKVTLYAVWQVNTYTVSFDANNGTGSTKAVITNGTKMSMTYDKAASLMATATRTGYIFNGWNTNANGSGTTYKTGSSIKNLSGTANKAVTLYAQWTPITYTVRMHSNKLPDVTSDETFTFDKTGKLPLNTFFNVGHSFMEWNTLANGEGTAYTDGQEIYNLSSTNNAVIDIYAQWGSISYQVKYNGNGATSGSMGEVGFEFDKTKKLTPNSYKKSGYNFAGWNTKADGSGTSYADEQPVTNLAENEGDVIELYAKWTPITYTITYNANKTTGTNEPVLTNSDDVIATYDADTKIAALATRVGYDFVGWTLDSEGKGTVYKTGGTVKNLTTVDDDTVTLYAKWEASSYTIHFDGNKGSGSTDVTLTNADDIKAAYDDKYELKATAARKGYQFKYWTTGADGSGSIYSSGDELCNLTAVKGATVTLYAQWSANSYSVKYNANNGVGTMESSAHTFDIESALNVNTYTRTGYSFSKWADSNTGTGNTYANGALVKNLATDNGSTKTLYAVWSPIHYTIKLDANDLQSTQTATLSKTSINAAYGTAYKLDAKGTMPGYNLTGWNTSADGSGTAYNIGDSVKNLSETEGDVITLYAQWAPIGYYITYDGNKGTGSSDVTVTGGDKIRVQYDVNQMITATANRKGYVFDGWTTKADGSGTVYSTGSMVKNLTTVEDSIVILYAKWTPITYTVHFDGNKGNGSTDPTINDADDITLQYDQKAKIRATGIRDGYNFFRWNTRSDGTGVNSYYEGDEIYNLSESDGAVITFYAQWDPIIYSVSYDGNKGEGEMELSSFKYDTPKALSPNAFIRKGYLFGGWSKARDAEAIYADKEEVVNLTKTEGDVVRLFATWNPITYYLTFDANGGTGSMDSQSVEYDTDAAINKNTFTKAGNNFVGWNTMPDGTGDSYTDGQKILNLTDEDQKVIKLYAQWDTISYEIEYDPNGGSGSMTNSKLKYDTPLVLTKNSYTKDGYLFNGWNTNADGTGTAYADGSIAKNLTETEGAVVKLYAQWTPIHYSIEFLENRGDIKSKVKLNNTTGYSNIAYGATFKLEANASAEGYQFVGWNTEADGSGTEYVEGSEYSNLASKDGAVVKLYAQWEEGSYHITYHLQGGSFVEGATYPESKGAADTVQLPGSDSVVRAGYVFRGWYSNPSGLGDVLTEIGDDITRDYDVYAVWDDEDGHADGIAPHVKHDLG